MNRVSNIYRLIDPVTFKIRYIGQTVRDLKSRLQDHCRCRDNTYVSNWIKSLKAQGLRPVIEVIVEVSIEDADYVECFYISYYRSLGCPLVNLDSGGRVNHNKSEETRAKMSAASKGKSRSYMVERNKSMEWTSEMRSRLSNNTSMRRPEVVEKMANSRSKDYEVISPEGNISSGRNLCKFCRDNNLNPSAMCLVAQGKWKQYRGWKCRYLPSAT